MIQEAWIWILIVILLAVAAPCIVDLIRKKDYKDQMNGKKPEREWKGKVSYDKPEHPDMKYEELKEEAARKTKDNISGIFH